MTSTRGRKATRVEFQVLQDEEKSADKWGTDWWLEKRRFFVGPSDLRRRKRNGITEY